LRSTLRSMKLCDHLRAVCKVCWLTRRTDEQESSGCVSIARALAQFRSYWSLSTRTYFVSTALASAPSGVAL
jgi:hypothetical protein